MKIVIFESDPSEEGYLKESLTGLDLAFVAEKLTLETAGQAAGADVVSIFTGSHIDAALLDAITGTKLIVTRTTGYDHVDLVAAKAKGVQVTNVPGYGSVAVAEHAFALLLAISRRIF
ncbi:MAG TPA: hydroxyacid dehydrogenase, partial [Candidatus Paceibacterota bacterium]